MRQMFAFMNTARLAVGAQGLGHAELSYQQALAYAQEVSSVLPLSANKQLPSNRRSPPGSMGANPGRGKESVHDTQKGGSAAR